MPKLLEIAEAVGGLSAAAAPQYYRDRIAEVAAVIEPRIRAFTEGLDDPDTFVATRFAIQSLVVDELRKRGGFSLATVRDDKDRRLAIPYFMIDLELLRLAAKQRRPTPR